MKAHVIVRGRIRKTLSNAGSCLWCGELVSGDQFGCFCDNAYRVGQRVLVWGKLGPRLVTDCERPISGYFVVPLLDRLVVRVARNP